MATIRDLGYRPYEGELLPSSHNTWVLLRYGIKRIWGSWLNKLAIIFSITPVFVYLLGLGITWLMLTEMGSHKERIEEWFVTQSAAVWMEAVTTPTLWLFVTILALRSGSGVIAEDLRYKAFAFYFAKPVTPLQYMLGRGLALAIFIFSVLLVPALFMNGGMMAVAPEGERLATAALIPAAILDSAIVAITLSTIAMAISSISKSRALTMSAFAVLFVVPHVLAMLVEQMAEIEWLYLFSIAGVMDVVGDAIYRRTDEFDQVQWFHALPVLLAMVGGSGYAVWTRLRRAEVIG